MNNIYFNPNLHLVTSQNQNTKLIANQSKVTNFALSKSTFGNLQSDTLSFGVSPDKFKKGIEALSEKAIGKKLKKITKLLTPTDSLAEDSYNCRKARGFVVSEFEPAKDCTALDLAVDQGFGNLAMIEALIKSPKDKLKAVYRAIYKVDYGTAKALTVGANEKEKAWAALFRKMDPLLEKIPKDPTWDPNNTTALGSAANKGIKAWPTIEAILKKNPQQIRDAWYPAMKNNDLELAQKLASFADGLKLN